MKRAAALLLLAVLGSLGWGVAAAGAGPPEQVWSFPIDEENVLVDCGGFQVVDHVTGQLTVTVWFNKDGTVNRLVTDYAGQHEIRNSVTSVAVTSPYHRKFMTDVDAGRTHVVGPAYTVTVPGVGAVLFDTGSIKIENGAVSASGRHETAGGELHRLCPALA